ncbi:NAD(P)-dependent oxidoreductase [Streptomyces sp. 7-21]|jgi:3-hydroxyisobutyrate dehydrogenase-like beta-hydroxyacid dehydrogenase|uniref:NAD(P)-dependent oxidoreductase n=1 Tax=Streptomyces sp. 7-21 TaxID=2802283 RepID=UPI00191E066E|nr:NAD(P)-binding domain-containing protein [Streptomyces sp. 7-21]MBL1067955.1 NAD(P)-dependent oxidoreductase [Streptomyces sp. 7-21]
MEQHATVTVLGLGAMGSALARALLAAGHRVTVWNRTAAKAAPLAELGARPAATAAEAVAASDLVLVCVVDYDASQEILDPLAGQLAGKTLVNVTSDTPGRAREAAAWAARHGIGYLDGAVMVPVPVIGSPAALLLFSGSREAFTAHEATLRALGGKTPFLGTDPGAAALYDIGMLDFFYSAMAGLIHAFALVGADGVSAAAFTPYAKEIGAILPAIIDEMAHGIDSGKHPGDAGNLDMEAASVAHIAHVSRERGLDTSVIDAVTAWMDRARADGGGGDAFSRIIDAIRPKDPAPAA